MKNSFSDGILEVMGLSGPMHLVMIVYMTHLLMILNLFLQGRIKSSLQNGIRIAQGSNVSIIINNTI